jgi:photosystem II stability/assembly factor-like uncharacterized protein
MKRPSILVSVLFLASALMRPAVATAASNASWIPVGPDGGSVQSLAVDPTDHLTLVAGTFEGGLYITHDGGASWVTTGLANDTVDSLAFTADGSTILAGVHTYTLGGEIQRSTDGGATWTLIEQYPVAAIVRTIATDPSDPLVAFAGVQNVGAVRTTDGGLSWEPTGLQPLDIESLAIDPTDPSVVYAAAGSSGPYKSVDDGATWTSIHTGLTDHYAALIAVDPSTPSTVYLATTSVLSKSDDGGATWHTTKVSGLVVALAFDPTNLDTVYAGTFTGVEVSTDGGATWHLASKGLSDRNIDALVADPVVGGTVFAGTDHAGVFRSTDGGVTWAARTDGVTAVTVVSVAPDPFTAGTVYVGTQYRGGYRSTDEGQTWTRMPMLGNIDAFGITPDPIAPDHVYAGTDSDGLIDSTDGGAAWTFVGPKGVSIYTMLLVPALPGTIYGGGASSVLKSEDGGSTWSESYEFLYGTFLSLAIDAADPHIVYAGSAANAGVVRTTDGGRSWRSVNAGTRRAAVEALASDPSTPGTLYMGNDDGIYKTTTYADLWTRIGTGIAGPINTIVVDPSNPSTVYLGSASQGVWVSTDAGQTWTALNDGLANLHVYRLAIDPTGSSLYAGTVGGGAFVLDLG